jgi:large subunit ribosomal protein L5
MNRLQDLYQKKVMPELKTALNIKNDLAVPKVDKIIINMGIGDTIKDKVAREKIIGYMGQIAGQKPQIRTTKKSIANFGTRSGDVVGVRVTIRGIRMYEFLDKLIGVVLPRVRDFQGISLNAFDQQGDYNLGLPEQIIFPEVEYDTIDRVRGLQITIKTTAHTREEALKLLMALGMPFEKEKE